MVDWDLVLISIIADEEEGAQANNRDRRRFWVDNLWKERESKGEFNNLFNDLKYDVQKFYDYHRMDYEKFQALLNICRPYIEKQRTNFRNPIEADQRLSLCLRFLITGSSFKSLGYSYRMGFSTVRSIVHETRRVIWNALRPSVMPKPTREKWTRIAMEFDEKWNFPNCIGAIDGKHFKIKAPRNSGSLYINYKKFFSIVLLAVVDANYKFVIADVGSYGRNSDGGIMQNSIFGKKLTSNALDIPPKKRLPRTDLELPYVFVADEAFPLTTNIMRPFSGDRLTDEAMKIYNYRLSRARRIVENAFGILQERFELCQKGIQVQPKYVDNIILACTCLHNFIIGGTSTESQNIASVSINLENDNNMNNALDGMTVREMFKDYFRSDEGSIPWQNDIVNRH
ncbi:uncharacterized protein LOC126973086 isoform X1 [Leptidea sinapis]|uniref:uncharacterized protein LOC126973086 isoform X1 n=1 Tax=Leptidea sinapis TaxID=189913 RepID=UPI0021C30E78|nr:uncharacterized protein LOC126973086 isoform X1 [Leptidea sinapis]